MITKFVILLPTDSGFSPEFIADYLFQSCDRQINYQNEEIGYPKDENRIIQKFAWFILSDPKFHDCNLANLNQSKLTPIGELSRLFSSLYKD